MISYKTFKELVKGRESVTSARGVVYKEIQVQGDFVSFRRENNIDPEIISLTEMYEMIYQLPLDQITTTSAKRFISGRVQSPAVAIIRDIFREIEENKEIEEKKKSCSDRMENSDIIQDKRKSKLRRNIGCFVIACIIFVVMSIMGTNSMKNDIEFSEAGTPCVVVKDAIGVYEASDVDRVKELIANGDSYTLSQMEWDGRVCHLLPNEKCTFVRYYDDGYIVVRSEERLRPVYVYKDYVKKK